MFGKSKRSSDPTDNIKANSIVICVPSNGLMHSAFVYSLLKLVEHLRKYNNEVYEIIDIGTVLSNQRQSLVHDALEYDPDYIMWLDSDMTFPANTVDRLISRHKDVVCAAYSKRIKPFHATAFESIDPVIPVKITTGVVPVRYAGMGCMLVKAHVYKQIDPPYFPLKWHEQSQSWHGEDMGFCDVLHKNNIEVFCDLDLSLAVGHVGNKEYRLSQEG